MASIGTMVAKLALDYSEFQRGIANSRNQLNGWQTYTVAVQSQAAKSTGATMATAAVSGAMAARSTRSSLGGLLQSTMGVVGSVARIGIGAASAYGNWRLQSIRMKNELIQNKLLTDMLGKGPSGGGVGSIAWINTMRNGLATNRSGLATTMRSVLGLSAAVAGIGAAAIYGYGAWRKQSLGIRSELLQQKLMTEQIRQLRSGGSVGGSAFGGGFLGGVTGGIAGMAMGHVASAAASVPMNSLKLAADAEQAAISFEVMMGSADKARAMLSQLKAYADKSPFDVAGVNAAAQKMMNYGIQAQDVLPTLKMLGDVAAGDMEKFDRLSTAFGQTAATGRLMGQDLLQFINAGFNPLQTIAAKTGETMTELKKRMEAGGISAMEVRDAFAAATGEGGRFYQMTARQTGTLAGLWSTFKDSVSTSLRQVGEAMVVSLDLKGWLAYLTTAMSQVPYIVANAGTLLQAELLGWGAFFAETIPYAEDAFKIIGGIMYATWEGAKASFQQFIKEIRQGFEDVINLAKAATMLRTNPAQAVGIMAGITARQNAPQRGKSGTELFQSKYDEALQAHADANFGTNNLSNKWKEQRAALLMDLAEREAADPTADFGGKLNASFNASSESDKKKKTKGDADSQAALKGSSEANKIFTSGASDKGLQIAAKQLDVQSATLAEMKALAANALNFSGGISASQSAAWQIAESDMSVVAKPKEKTGMSRGQLLNWAAAESAPVQAGPKASGTQTGMSRGQELNWAKAESNKEQLRLFEKMLMALEKLANENNSPVPIEVVNL